MDGPFFGEHLFYYINDGGEDNLGLDRRLLDPEVTNRFRMPAPASSRAWLMIWTSRRNSVGFPTATS